jgi:hypothetical protein
MISKENQLANVSVEELQEELARRLAPQVQKNIDWSPVQKMAEERVKELINDTDDEESDFRIVQAVMTAVYGKDYFDWESKQLEPQWNSNFVLSSIGLQN